VSTVLAALLGHRFACLVSDVRLGSSGNRGPSDRDCTDTSKGLGQELFIICLSSSVFKLVTRYCKVLKLVRDLENESQLPQL